MTEESIPQPRHKFADPEKNLDDWTRVNDIVGRRARGQRADEIAAETGVPVRTVYKAIAAAADHQRASVTARVNEAFMIHDRILDDLIRIVRDRITEMTRPIDPVPFDIQVIRGLIYVLERQAKLLDLDVMKKGAKGAAGTHGSHDWIEKMSDTEVLNHVEKEYGVVLPPSVFAAVA